MVRHKNTRKIPQTGFFKELDNFYMLSFAPIPFLNLLGKSEVK